MKKLFCIIVFNLCLLSGFSQEYGYLLANITNAEKTITPNEKGQLVNNNKELDNVFKDFSVFSYKYAYPKAKNEYLRKFVSIECNCDIKELAKYLKENYSSSFSDIEYTQDLGYPEYNPSDAMWSQTNPDGTPILWHLNKIEADKAWNITKGSSDITIAIIDQGFDISHPDLANKIFSTTDPRTNNPFGHVKKYHGTFCASFAGAQTDGGGRLSSVGFNTMLMFYDYYNVSAADIAYHASFEKGADVISYSWGGLTSATAREKLLVQEVLDNGTVIVRSAGNTQSNSDNDRFPFAHQVDNRIIIVSSTGKDDCHSRAGTAPHANYLEVSICSPGYNVMGAIRYNDGNIANPYIRESGTSYATPIVAGVCALLKSMNRDLTPAQIKNIIQTTADPVVDAHLYPGTIGAGRINAYKAVQTLCTTTNLTGQNINNDQTTIVTDCNINVKNVTIENGSKLILDADHETTIQGDFEVQAGAELEIR
ncbi:MAG: S8/S53 family peptidase [Bacteroidales bacterium]|jgi:subtilisin family serine protease|nr:S8/S53 family peptidase [Bacteroidales bacterium]